MTDPVIEINGVDVLAADEVRDRTITLRLQSLDLTLVDPLVIPQMGHSLTCDAPVWEGVVTRISTSEIGDTLFVDVTATNQDTATPDDAPFGVSDDADGSSTMPYLIRSFNVAQSRTEQGDETTVSFDILEPGLLPGMTVEVTNANHGLTEVEFPVQDVTVTWPVSSQRFFGVTTGAIRTSLKAAVRRIANPTVYDPTTQPAACSTVGLSAEVSGALSGGSGIGPDVTGGSGGLTVVGIAIGENGTALWGPTGELVAAGSGWSEQDSPQGDGTHTGTNLAWKADGTGDLNWSWTGNDAVDGRQVAVFIPGASFVQSSTGVGVGNTLEWGSPLTPGNMIVLWRVAEGPTGWSNDPGINGNAGGGWTELADVSGALQHGDSNVGMYAVCVEADSDYQTGDAPSSWWSHAIEVSISAAVPPLIGQQVNEYVTAPGSEDEFVTNHPYREGTLRVTVGGVHVLADETDPDAGEFTLPFEPTAGAIIAVTYKAKARVTGSGTLSYTPPAGTPVVPSQAIDFGESGDISTLDYSDSPAAGTSNEVARADHVHGMPADPGGGGGGLTQAYVGYNTIGGSWLSFTEHRVFAKKVTLANDCLLTDIEAYVRSSGANDEVESFAGAILSDNSGTPQYLIQFATGPRLLFDSSPGSGGDATGRWFGVPIGRWLAAGDYWIAIAVFENPAAIQVAYDGSGADRYYTAGGPWFADWGWYSPTTMTDRLSIRANTIR